MRIMTFWGSVLGYPCLGNYQIVAKHTPNQVSKALISGQERIGGGSQNWGLSMVSLIQY